jgi:hypothetical protein
MKRSYFIPVQISGILKEFDYGKNAEDITCEHGYVKPLSTNGGNATGTWGYRT